MRKSRKARRELVRWLRKQHDTARPGTPEHEAYADIVLWKITGFTGLKIASTGDHWEQVLSAAGKLTEEETEAVLETIERINALTYDEA